MLQVIPLASLLIIYSILSEDLFSTPDIYLTHIFYTALVWFCSVLFLYRMTGKEMKYEKGFLVVFVLIIDIAKKNIVRWQTLGLVCC